MKHFSSISALLMLFISCVCLKSIAQELPKKYDVDGKYMMEIISDLASKEYSGRLPGSEGYNKAATYIAEQFRKHRIKPIDKDSYFQYFNVENNEIQSPLKLQMISNDGNNTEFKPGKDFVCRGFTGRGVDTADVVFCGYGISLPKQGYDDYAEMNVKGKIVILFKDNPTWKFKTEWPSSIPRYKAMIAAQYGAVGVMLVSSKYNASRQPIGSIATGTMNQHNLETTSIHITPEVANNFLKQKGYNIDQLQSIIDSTKKPFSLDLGIKAYTEIHTKYTQQKPTMNVVGMLEGNDSILKKEYLIIGAHLDHVGSQGNDLYFPGANDNASGVAAVLQMAKLFSENRYLLKRSVIFVLFANEEQGLKGSWHYINNPLAPLENTVAMINLDCIGFGDSIQVGNGKSAPLLWQLARNLDKENDKMMIEATWNGGGADATPFYDKNIPALYFVGSNSYSHLHLPSDTPETINNALLKKITKLAYATAWQIAASKYKKEKNIR